MHLVRSLAVRPRPQTHDIDSEPARYAVLARAVEDEVIPRLLKACETFHSQPAQPAEQLQPAQSADQLQPAPMTEDVAALTEVLLTGTQPQATAFVEHMQGSGVSGESLFLHLLTPAARKLGAMWADDDCDFTDVTIGMLRLANVMRVVAHAFEAEAAPVLRGPRALLVQAPGEQHGFGIAMVACFFRRAGWNVLCEPMADSVSLIALVQREWFSLVGLSLACSDKLENLAADIRAIRAASRNPAIGIMVGGFVFTERPQLADMVGADCTATDARRAVQQANALVSQLACAQ